MIYDKEANLITATCIWSRNCNLFAQPLVEVEHARKSRSYHLFWFVAFLVIPGTSLEVER